MSVEVKVCEVKKCIVEGVDEIDMVINIGFLKVGFIKSVREEILVVKKGIGNKVLKVIIEICYLFDEEKKFVCIIVEKVGVDYVKILIGFGIGGVILKDIILMWEFISM